MNAQDPLEPARSRPAVLTAVAFVTAAVLLGLWYHRQTSLAARGYPTTATVDLTEPTAPAPTPPASPADAELPELRVAIAPVISPERNLEIYQALVTYLAESVHRRPVFICRRSYAEINDVVRAAQCDMALVCTYAFVRGEREFGMKLLAIPQVGGVRTYQGFIIVPADSPARSLLDLEGKRFAYVDVMSTSGFLYAKTALLKAGRTPERFFASEMFSGSHDRSILAVADHLVDGASVDSVVYRGLLARDPSLATKVRVVARSEIFGMPPLVVPAGIDPVLESRLVEILLAMHTTPAGAAILRNLHIDRFVHARAEDYDSVRRAVALWEDR